MPIVTHRLRLLNFDLLINTDNLQLGKIIAQEINAYYSHLPASTHQTGEEISTIPLLRFSISCSEKDESKTTKPPPRHPKPTLSYLPGDKILRITLPYGCGSVAIEYLHNAVTAVVSPAIFRYQNVLFNWIVIIPLAELVRQWGYYFLHAAALTKDENAIVFAGKSTSGKTTLTLSLLSQGWRVITDDEGFLRYDHSFILYGCSSWAKLTPATWRQFAAYLGPAADFQGKRRCDLSLLFPQKPLPQAPVGAICLISPGKTNHISRLQPVDAVSRLLDLAFLPGYPPYARATFHFFCQMAAIVPVYRLRFSLQPQALNQLLHKEVLSRIE